MRISYEPKGMQFATQEYIGGFCTIVLHYPCLKLRYTDTDAPRVHPCAQHRYQKAQGNATKAIGMQPWRTSRETLRTTGAKGSANSTPVICSELT